MTEECALIAVLEGGALDVRFLPRRLQAPTAASTSSAEEQTPLNVPKKTKLYIEFAQREREQAQALHHSFQRYAWSMDCCQRPVAAYLCLTVM
jgi:hypothetical protein